ncbi:MAG: hypothetical protein KatS3mg060_0107 [Dehalococcoidia bacterium]|nr:MAG: hypothetical protein KatS3mg060_0107 [Dehalococcoidia bacterium]
MLGRPDDREKATHRLNTWRIGVPTELGKRYLCTVCNSEVIVTKKGTGDLSCCGKAMELKK